MRRDAFTLIELLIVVAVIGILAVISVVNLRHAHLRAQLAASLANMKSLDSAVKQSYIDRGVLLVDMNDGNRDWGRERILTVYGGVGDTDVQERDYWDILAPLTSPVAYLGKVPVDPFVTGELLAYLKERNADPGIITAENLYSYDDNDPEDRKRMDCMCLFEIGVDAWAPQAIYYLAPHLLPRTMLKEGDFLLTGMGPGMVRHDINGEVGYGFYPLPFAVSNGLISYGILIRHSSSGIID